MPKTVYVETTIPSAYATPREDPPSVYRRDLTRQWWEQQARLYELVTSQATLAELGAGAYEGQTEALQLVAALPLLAITDEALAIAELYVRHHLMPEPASGDALHLALASLHEIDYFLTWNIRHLANPNKVEHLAVVNRRLGLLSPVITSPEALWIEDIR
jgi:predicted nucleic acid-binding protein